MARECVFCQILAGELPCHRVYEDETTMAFLDQHPINPGHVLVIPKTHVSDFFKLEDDRFLALMLSVKRVAVRVNSGIQPEKVGLVIAGWDVAHTHVHIIPMHDYHDITSKSLMEDKRSNPTGDELAAIALRLRQESGE